MPNLKRLEELLTRVVPFIPPRQFDMEYVRNDCGSPSCLAGFAMAHFDEMQWGWEKFFGLTEDEAEHLFGCHHPNDVSQAACRIIDVIEFWKGEK